MEINISLTKTRTVNKSNTSWKEHAESVYDVLDSFDRSQVSRQDPPCEPGKRLIDRPDDTGFTNASFPPNKLKHDHTADQYSELDFNSRIN